MYGRTWNYNGGTYMIISERIFYIMEQKNMSQLELSRGTGDKGRPLSSVRPGQTASSGKKQFW
jgi:hypothetical protein